MLAVIDDDFIILEAICTALSDEGMTVKGYSSAEQALADFDANGCPTMVVSDVILGSGMNGFDLGKQVKALYGHVMIIYITAFAMNSVNSRISPCEFIVYKPFGLSEFTALIKQHYPGPLPPD